MSNTHDVKGSNDFQDKLESNKDKYVLVDFWAEWCGPCKAAEPILDRISEELADQVTLVKVDIEEDDNRDLVQKYGVMSIPNMLLFKPANGTKDSEEGSDSTSSAGDAEREYSNNIGFKPEPVMLSWLRDNGVDVDAMAA